MYDTYMIIDNDTIDIIASKFNTSPEILYQLNGRNVKIIPGNTLVVPKNNNSLFDYYTVSKGDTLYKIAEVNNIDPNLLAELNGIEKELAQLDAAHKFIDSIYSNTMTTADLTAKVTALDANEIKEVATSREAAFNDVQKKYEIVLEVRTYAQEKVDYVNDVFSSESFTAKYSEAVGNDYGYEFRRLGDFISVPTVLTASNVATAFALTDANGKALPNVTAVVYKEQESGFLAGYAAVMDGYRKLGFTGGGGGTNPACNRFGYGFVQGAEAAAKALNLEAGAVEVKFSFQHGASFSASPELKTQISGWYQGGTEVVFACGGSMFESVKAAAEEAGADAKIIGVDVDQAPLSDRVITSAVKGLKESVQIVLGQFFGGKWDAELAGKTQNLGAADNATGLPIATSRFTTFTANDYNALFAKIKSGEITPDANTPADANNADWLNAAVELVTIVFEA